MTALVMEKSNGPTLGIETIVWTFSSWRASTILFALFFRQHPRSSAHCRRRRRRRRAWRLDIRPVDRPAVEDREKHDEGQADGKDVERVARARATTRTTAMTARRTRNPRMAKAGADVANRRAPNAGTAGEDVVRHGQRQPDRDRYQRERQNALPIIRYRESPPLAVAPASRGPSSPCSRRHALHHPPPVRPAPIPADEQEGDHIHEAEIAPTNTPATMSHGLVPIHRSSTITQAGEDHHEADEREAHRLHASPQSRRGSSLMAAASPRPRHYNTPNDISITLAEISIPRYGSLTHRIRDGSSAHAVKPRSRLLEHLHGEGSG